MSDVDKVVEEKQAELAKKMGIKEAARARILPLLGEEDTRERRIDRVKAELGVLKGFTKDYAHVADKLDPSMKDAIARFSGEALSKLGGVEEEEDPMEAGLRKATKYIAYIKAMDIAGDAARPKSDGQTDAKTLEAVVKPITDTLKAMQEEIAGKRKDEMNETLKKILDKLNPVGNPAPGAPESPVEILTKAANVKNELVTSLGTLGYKLDSENLTKQQWELEKKNFETVLTDKILGDAEFIKKHMASKGYTFEGGPVPWLDAVKMRDEAVKGARDEKMEDAQLKSVTDVIKTAIHEVVGGVFAPFAAKWSEGFVNEPQPSNFEPAPQNPDVQNPAPPPPDLPPSERDRGHTWVPKRQNPDSDPNLGR